MKKVLIVLLSLFAIFSFMTPITFGECNPDLDTDWTIGEALDGCLNDSKLVDGGNVKVAGGFGNVIKTWVNNISIYLGVFAVGSIVLGALMMTLSGGEEEKINKAKDIIKWGIIGFLGLIFASAIINLVIRIMYSL